MQQKQNRGMRVWFTGAKIEPVFCACYLVRDSFAAEERDPVSQWNIFELVAGFEPEYATQTIIGLLNSDAEEFPSLLTLLARATTLT